MLYRTSITNLPTCRYVLQIAYHNCDSFFFQLTGISRTSFLNFTYALLRFIFFHTVSVVKLYKKERGKRVTKVPHFFTTFYASRNTKTTNFLSKNYLVLLPWETTGILAPFERHPRTFSSTNSTQPLKKTSKKSFYRNNNKKAQNPQINPERDSGAIHLFP